MIKIIKIFYICFLWSLQILMCLSVHPAPDEPHFSAHPCVASDCVHFNWQFRL